MRLFLDANELFTAAHNPEGRAAALFALARQGTCVLTSSRHALEEARRNLALKYPPAASALEGLLPDVTIEGEAPPVVVTWALEQGLPLKDAPILAAAAHSHCDALVTGDRTHFGSLFGRSFKRVRVLSPAQALAQVLG
jgi:predicted nucleic acid-binding protein